MQVCCLLGLVEAEIVRFCISKFFIRITLFTFTLLYLAHPQHVSLCLLTTLYKQCFQIPDSTPANLGHANSANMTEFKFGNKCTKWENDEYIFEHMCLKGVKRWNKGRFSVGLCIFVFSYAFDICKSCLLQEWPFINISQCFSIFSVFSHPYSM